VFFPYAFPWVGFFPDMTPLQDHTLSGERKGEGANPETIPDIRLLVLLE